MPIALRCACGTVLRTAEGNAGKRVRCPKCSALVAVPARGITARPGGAPGPEPLAMDAVLADRDVPVAELADDEDIKTVELAEDEEVEALEGDRDLPEVRPARRRRRETAARPGPRRGAVEGYSHRRPLSLFGMTLASWVRIGLLVSCGFVTVFALLTILAALLGGRYGIIVLAGVGLLIFVGIAALIYRVLE